MTRVLSRAITLLACAMLAASPAIAKDNDHGKGKGKHKHYEKHHKHEKHGKRSGHDDDVNINIIIGSNDRVIIRDYYRKHGHHCPPGLAKKRNGCMPPGQYKKYVRGEYLPDYVYWEPLPRDLLIHLHPAPHGHRYVMVDQNVLLISEASKKIIDAITLLSAVD
jgi:Ni/Co efflux regulator RcnB